MTNMSAMAREIEQSPRAAGGDRDIHNLSHVYQELSSLQKSDGGAQSQAFQRDLGQLNQKLQNDGVLPNLQITGIDNNDHILTQNAKTGEASSQAANNVYDFGQPKQADATPASPLNMMANAFGIQQNSDGRYTSPADNGPQAAGSILQTIMSGMLGGGSQPQQQDANGDNIPTPPSAPGLNPFMAQAWSGWGDASPDEAPADS